MFCLSQTVEEKSGIETKNATPEYANIRTDLGMAIPLFSGSVPLRSALSLVLSTNLWPNLTFASAQEVFGLLKHTISHTYYI